MVLKKKKRTAIGKMAMEKDYHEYHLAMNYFTIFLMFY